MELERLEDIIERERGDQDLEIGIETHSAN